MIPILKAGRFIRRSKTPSAPSLTASVTFRSLFHWCQWGRTWIQMIDVSFFVQSEIVHHVYSCHEMEISGQISTKSILEFPRKHGIDVSRINVSLQGIYQWSQSWLEHLVSTYLWSIMRYWGTCNPNANKIQLSKCHPSPSLNLWRSEFFVWKDTQTIFSVDPNFQCSSLSQRLREHNLNLLVPLLWLHLNTIYIYVDLWTTTSNWMFVELFIIWQVGCSYGKPPKNGRLV